MSPPCSARTPRPPSPSPRGGEEPGRDRHQGGRQHRQARGERRGGQQRHEGRRHRDRHGLPMTQSRPQQRQEGRGRGGVQPPGAGIGHVLPGQRPQQGEQVPEDVDAHAGRPEAGPARLGGDGGGGVRRGLVDGQLSTRQALPAAARQCGGQREAVQGVAHAQQQRGQGGADHRAAPTDHADEGELAAAGEHHRGQHHRLPHVQTRGGGQGPERDAVQPRGQADRPAGAADPADLVRDGLRGGGVGRAHDAAHCTVTRDDGHRGVHLPV